MASVDYHENELKGRQFYAPNSRAEKELNDPNSITHALANGIYKSTGYTLGVGCIRAAAMHKVVSDMADFRSLPDYIQLALLRLYERKREMSAEDFIEYRREIVTNLTDLLHTNMHEYDTIISGRLLKSAISDTTL